MEQYLPDILILIIMLLAVIRGWRRGFIRALLEIVAMILSLLGASWTAGYLTPILVDRFRPVLAEKIAGMLSGTAAAGTYETAGFMTEVFGQDGWESIRGLMDGLDLDGMLSMIGQAGEEALLTLVGSLLQPIIHTAVFVLSFVVLLLVIRLVTIPLRLAERLPVLRTLSRIGGGLLGAVCGAVLVSVGLWACTTFRFAAPDMIDNSRLAPYFMGGAWLDYMIELFK